MDPGINKPFDRVAKEFAEEAPMLFLNLLGIAGPGAGVALEPLRPQSAPQVVMPDHVALLSIAWQKACAFYGEFFLQYRKDVMRLGRAEAKRLGALEEMLYGGGPRMGLVEAILEGWSLVAEVRQKAEAQGEA